MSYDQDPRRPSFTPPPQQAPGWPPQGQPPYPPQQPYGQQYPPQQWPQYAPPQPPPGQPPRRRRKHRGPRVFAFSSLGLLVIIVIAIVASNHGNSQASAPPAASTSAPAAAASSPAAPSVRAHTVATFTGSGQSNTPRFTVTSTWKLVYSFNCSAFGQSGNFQVYEDGGNDSNLSVNDLAMSKSASTWAYGDGGQHFLQINSECAWKVRVVDEP